MQLLVFNNSRSSARLTLLILVALVVKQSYASLGDHLPDFRECVEVSQLVCDDTVLLIIFRCVKQRTATLDIPLCVSSTIFLDIVFLTTIALHLRLLLWTCPAECDYTCQHIITDRRVRRNPPMLNPVVQFHGKWPFYRFLGAQEPFSVLFSLLNLLAHQQGISKVRESVPSRYSLRPYYLLFGYFGLAAWTFSMIFHTRDFDFTEKMDYFAAGASVLYGLYYSTIRIFRLDHPKHAKTIQVWTVFCLGLYAAHVIYLTAWSWDYSYNMTANVVVGAVHNLLWSWFSIARYRRLHKPWAAWPGLIVAWIILAMSLELLDFPPLWGMIDAHSLWHLGTVFPTIWWYK